MKYRNKRLIYSKRGNKKRNKYINKNKIIICSLIGLIVLSLAVVISWAVYSHMHREVVLPTIEMSEPTLPKISFQQDGHEINTLPAYTREMDITTMRDVITPLDPQGKIEMLLDTQGQGVSAVIYTIQSMDGEKIITEKAVENPVEGTMELDLNNVVAPKEELMMQLKLTLSSGLESYFYTRVCAYDQFNLLEKMSYAEQFHKATFESDYKTFSNTYGVSGTAGVKNLQQVTLSSGAEAITWGELAPVVRGDVRWNIKECTPIFTMIQLEYHVEAASENNHEVMELYEVKEFFRLTYSTKDGTVKVSQYQRTMDQILDTRNIQVSKEGIDLGITDSNIEWVANEDYTNVAFVQERSLWHYNKIANKVTKVFSFADAADADARYWYDMHDIRILSIEENGNIIFSVYGYMNRGDHEGKVGAILYSYNVQTNMIEEKLFVDYNKSFAIAEETLSQWVYLSATQNQAYIIALDAFYKVDLENGTQTKLTSAMSPNQYAISETGDVIAYQSLNDDMTNGVTVLQLETGAKYEIHGENGETIIPIGFVYNDFVYGRAKESDINVDEFDMTIEPMYALEIRDTKGTVMKTYEKTDYFITEASVSNNQVDLALVQIKDGYYIYGGKDIVTNNVTQEDSKVSIKTYKTDRKLSQKRLEIGSDIDTETVEIQSADMAEKTNAYKVSYDISKENKGYYVYAYGEMTKAYQLPSDAIRYASEHNGSVLNGKQQYVWRSGSRDLTFYSSNKSDWVRRLRNDENILDIMASYTPDQVVNYTGCTMEQMCYLINNGQVIAAKKDGNWILLFGYTGNNMYYLNEAGDTYFMNMSTLGNQVQYMIGNGNV